MDKPTVTTELFDELAAKHGGKDRVKCLVDEESGVEIVIKVPTEAAWKNFQHSISDDDKRPGAAAQLMVDVVVFPDLTTWRKIVSQCPGLVQSFGNEASKFAGARRQIQEKKF